MTYFRAFEWAPPEFGHLPLIVNSDGTKLSKRQSDVKVEDYRNKGEVLLKCSGRSQFGRVFLRI